MLIMDKHECMTTAITSQLDGQENTPRKKVNHGMYRGNLRRTSEKEMEKIVKKQDSPLHSRDNVD